ncbi:MAG: hypothetical protein JRG95_20125 [Deltaproteobacteria bacterium]|nr:hypothetical protein [Deltaproteobacteria bacterium]
MGLAWGHGQLALVHLVDAPAGHGLAACAVLPDDADALRSWVHAQGLVGARCVLVPADEDCVLRVLDAPDVPEEERRESARWLVQDLLDFPAEEAWIDLLEIPVDEGWTRTRKVVVAAGQAEGLRRRVEQARRAGLRPVGFDVRERALLALADPARDQAGVAVLDLQPKAGLLVVGERGELHVSRHLGIDADSLGDDGAIEWNDGGTPEAPSDEAAPAFEGLLLELQRSLDYVESEFGRSPIRRLVVGPAESELSALAPYLEQNLRLEVEFLDLTQLFPGEATPNAAEQAQTLAAAGAALGPGNLFTAELAPKREAYAGPSLRSLAQMSAAVAVFGMLQFGIDQLQARSLRSELVVLESQAEATRARLTALGAEIARAEADPTQQARVDALEARRRAQATLLQQLEGERGPGRPFAGLLTALAERPVEGLWLTRVQLRDEGRALTLEGAALGPDQMPLLLARLKAEPAFDGVSFESVRIHRPEDGGGHIEFMLETSPSVEDLPGNPLSRKPVREALP